LSGVLVDFRSGGGEDELCKLSVLFPFAQSAFVVDGEVEPLVLKVMESHLKDKAYDDKLVAGWVNFINEDVMVSVVLLQPAPLPILSAAVTLCVHTVWS
jgi:hypothetical protein